MSKPDGIYLSVDYRVTNARTGALIDDASIKSLTIHYPPFDSGPKVLLGFTGLAILPDGTPAQTWIRETLRGEVENVDQSMSHLRARLDRDIAPLKVGLIINFLGIMGNRRFFGALTNLRQDLSVMPKFSYMLQEPNGWSLYANGSGAKRAIVDGHLERLKPHLGVVPREPKNHMNLLASVNRRVAAKDKSVSPFCHVTFISSDGRTSPISHSFTQRGESTPFEIPVLAYGLDVMELSRMWNGPGGAFLKNGIFPPPVDNKEIDTRINRRP